MAFVKYKKRYLHCDFSASIYADELITKNGCCVTGVTPGIVSFSLFFSSDTGSTIF